MQQVAAPVVAIETLAPSLRLIWLAGDSLGTLRSGQFVMAACGDGYDPLLRRALSLHRRQRPDGAYGFLFGTTKLWGRWLAARRPGDTVDVITPLGKGFQRDRAARHLLLVGESLGVAPLVALAEEAVAAGCAVTLVTDAATAGGLYPIDRLPAEVEVHALTADGSSGRQGRARDVAVELLPWSDQIFLSGSTGLFTAVRTALKTNMSRTPAQVIVEEKMACGVGACLGCVVPTKGGVVAACVAGPVFDLMELRS